MIAVLYAVVFGSVVGWMAARDPLLALFVAVGCVVIALAVELFLAWRASREWDRP